MFSIVLKSKPLLSSGSTGWSHKWKVRVFIDSSYLPTVQAITGTVERVIAKAHVHRKGTLCTEHKWTPCLVPPHFLPCLHIYCWIHRPWPGDSINWWSRTVIWGHLNYKARANQRDKGSNGNSSAQYASTCYFVKPRQSKGCCKRHCGNYFPRGLGGGCEQIIRLQIALSKVEMFLEKQFLLHVGN